MSKIIKFAKVIRRNWKKSTVFFGLVAWGTSYGIERYKTFQMMRAYCEEAKIFGEKVESNHLKPKHVTVILNPEANNKKSNVQFEKFAAPLLHLAGYKVSIFQTESEKQARDLMEVMSNTDAVLVAGGDGTLHEVVTGLLRRPGNENECLPIGIIPVGKTNTIAKHLFSSKSSSQAQLMAEAVMAVIHDSTVTLDIMKVKYDNEEKPIYAVSSFEQGAFAEVEPKVQKYWYLGSLKDKFTYFFNAFKNYSSIQFSQLQYVAPCNGCSLCYISPKLKEKSNQGERWWSAFVPRKIDTKTSKELKDYSKVVNKECGKTIPLESSFTNFSVYTSSADPCQNNGDSLLWVKMYSKNLSFWQFLTSGLNHRKSKLQSCTEPCTIINAREVKIIMPEESTPEESELYSYIDQEKYKMSSCDITLIPKRVTIYG